MVQKASFFPTKTDVLISAKKSIAELYGLNRGRISTKQVALPLAGGGTPSQASESGGTGNFLRTQGDTMIGPIAFFPVTVAIDGNDAIDIGQNSGTDNSPDYSSFAFVSGGPTNDLELIKGAAFSGQWLILQFAQTEIITLEDFTNNASGNLLTPDGNNIVIDNTVAPQIVSLIFDVTAGPNGNFGGWRVMTVSSGGTADVPDGNVENDHLEWDDTNKKWLAQQFFEFGPVPATIGELRFGNNDIVAWRNQANTNNIVMVVGADDVIDFQAGVAVDVSTMPITGVGHIQSSAANIPLSGFVRMGNGETIEMRNSTNTDNLIFGSSVINDQFLWIVNSNIQLSLDINILDLHNNEINNTAGIFTANDGLDDIGTQTLPYNQVNCDGIRFANNTTITPSQPMIGLTSAEMNFNVASGQLFHFKVNAVDEYLMTELAFQIKNLNQLHFLDSGDAQDIKVFYQDPTLTVDLSGSAAAMLIDNKDVLPVFILGGNNTGATLLAHELRFRGKDSGSTNVDYGSIKVRQNTVTPGSEEAEMEFQVIKGGVTANTFYEINSIFGENRFLEDVTLGTNATKIGMGERFIEFNDKSDAAVPTPSSGNRRVYFSLEEDAMVAKDFAGTVHNLEVDTGGAGGGGGGTGGGIFAKVVKSVDESVDNSTFQDDDELRFLANINTTYGFFMHIVGGAVPGGPDWKYRFTLPTGATGRITANPLDSSAGRQTIDMATGDNQINFNNDPAGEPDSLDFVGNLTMGTTAGVVQLQWAQMATVGGFPITVQKGSYIVVYEEGSSTAGGGGVGESKTWASLTKTVDETVNNSSTLQLDDELAFSVKANKSYGFIMCLFIQSDSNADFKSSFVLPSGATGEMNDQDMRAGPTTPAFTRDVTTTVNLGTNNAVQMVNSHGRINVGSTGGDVALQWAQNFAQVADTKVLAGSFIRVFEEGSLIGDPAGVDALIHTKVVKTTDEIVNGSTTLQNDDELFFIGNSNKVYHWVLHLEWNSVTTTPNLNTDWTLPSGATGVKNVAGWSSSGTSTPEDITTAKSFSVGSGNHFVEFHGIIRMGSTAGTCNFLWAQNVVAVEDTTMLAGSSLVVYEEGTQTKTQPEQGTVRQSGEDVIAIYEDRSLISHTNATIANPVIVGRWQIIRPSGLTEFNNIGFEIDLSAFGRRISGSGSTIVALITSPDNSTWTARDNVTFATGSFVADASYHFVTEFTSTIQYIAVAIYGQFSPQVGEAREVKVSARLNFPAGYTLVDIL